jgi:L-asparaginase
MQRLALFVSVALLVSSTASAQGQAARPVVWVLSTGGTTAGTGVSSTDLANKSGVLQGADLVKALPQIAAIADVHVEQIVNVSSQDITTEHWLLLAKRIAAIYADATVAGVVVTHGTNTLEETAYFRT